MGLDGSVWFGSDQIFWPLLILSRQEILEKIQRANKLSAFLKSIKPEKKNISEIYINSDSLTSVKYKMTGT